MLPLAVIYAQSIQVAGIIAIFKFKKASPAFYPFIIMIWLACFNELLGAGLMEAGYYTNVNNNIYVLAEAILFTIFFYNLGIFERVRTLFSLILSIIVMVWLWENLRFKITRIDSWFRIVYSFIIVLMSITEINRLIIADVNKPVEQTGNYLIKNPVFLICIGAIVYFTFKVLVEIFWLYGQNAGSLFRIKVFRILEFINLGVNLIYALAVLWVPPKQIYTTTY